MTGEIKRPLRLRADLFSALGRINVELVQLEDRSCSATTTTPPPVGSVAVLARNGFRACAMVSAAEATALTLTFDEPLSERRLDWLLGSGRVQPHLRHGLDVMLEAA